MELGSPIFTGDKARQVIGSDAGFPASVLFALKDPQSAAQGLDLIVDEGEGTETVPFDGEGQPAHYYRFEEVLRGLTLRADQSPPGYKYDAPAIPFDPAGVWDFPDNPKMADYPEGSAERARVTEFDKTYSDLLRLLQRAFDGETQQIGAARGQMGALRVKAQDLVKITDPRTHRQLGPTFEFIPA